MSYTINTRAVYSQEEMRIIMDALCDEVSITKDSLKDIIAMHKDWPDERTIRRWIIKDESFFKMYRAAKVLQAYVLVDEIIDISDDTSDDYIKDDLGRVKVNKEHISRSSLRVNSRKWIAAKLVPRLFGNDFLEDADEKIASLNEKMHKMKELLSQCMPPA